jgi:spoIIIJ-associated protein
MKNNIEVVRDLINELLVLMGTNAKAMVSWDQENEAFMVEIDTADEQGLLIGKRGETLASLQVLLGMMLRQKTGAWVRVIVNVGDWRQKQETRLQEIAAQAKARALETSEPQALYNLSPAERRIIHLFLAKDKEVVTESQGEGRDRFLLIRKNEGKAVKKS